MTAPAARSPARPAPPWRRLATTMGPGLVVMLADTDAGSVLTAAQSGAQWGYALLAPQILAIPILYATQELTIRLGVGTGLGLAELIRARYGRVWAWIAVGLLAISCFGALMTQLAALAGLAATFGVYPPFMVFAAVAFFIAIATLGAHASVERVAIVFGLFELAFFIVAWRAAPDTVAMRDQIGLGPIRDPAYLYLVAANIGTTLLPWAAFYQQSATVEKRMDIAGVASARWETLGGAALCQLITAAILIAGAAAAGHGFGAGPFATIGGLADTFTLALGPRVGHFVFALGLCGSALVAALAVTLAISWAVGEVAGVRHSLSHDPREAPWFYAAFVAMLIGGGVFVASGVDPVRLAIATGVVNAILLPAVLLVLFQLARTELKGALALRGLYAAALGAVFILASAVALYSGFVGAAG